ncbi:hypothetical protein [Olivibacter domesticus]|uniref:Uncharacterized protein n=1 Tax=Olivibacter domesticus TaxID=407022 RepID=A0A1H7HBR6_OLID1|nr:hypothetical protein [Olivibacter domesticus]SEK47187.1 hypothetical protein SAMN05661044_00323 [Olivibacter domesticus]
MNLKITSIVAAIGFIIISCGQRSIKQEGEHAKDSTTITSVATNAVIPFFEAKNYFVKNTYKNEEVATLKITSQEEFDNVFGPATVMGEKGKPTQLDFSKQYALAVITPVTNKETSLRVNSLTYRNTEIVLDYKITEDESQSFTTQPFLLILVDKEYSGSVNFEKE